MGARVLARGRTRRTLDRAPGRWRRVPGRAGRRARARAARPRRAPLCDAVLRAVLAAAGTCCAAVPSRQPGTPGQRRLLQAPAWRRAQPHRWACSVCWTLLRLCHPRLSCCSEAFGKLWCTLCRAVLRRMSCAAVGSVGRHRQRRVAPQTRDWRQTSARAQARASTRRARGRSWRRWRCWRRSWASTRPATLQPRAFRASTSPSSPSASGRRCSSTRRAAAWRPERVGHAPAAHVALCSEHEAACRAKLAPAQLGPPGATVRLSGRKASWDRSSGAVGCACVRRTCTLPDAAWARAGTVRGPRGWRACQTRTRLRDVSQRAGARRPRAAAQPMQP